MSEITTTKKEVKRPFEKPHEVIFLQVLSHFFEFHSFQWVVCPPFLWAGSPQVIPGTQAVPGDAATLILPGWGLSLSKGTGPEMNFMAGSRAGFSWSSSLCQSHAPAPLPYYPIKQNATMESLHQPKPPSNFWCRNAKFCLTDIIH